MNPNTLTMMDLLEVFITLQHISFKGKVIFKVNTFKIMDCNKAHFDKEIIQ